MDQTSKPEPWREIYEKQWAEWKAEEKRIDEEQAAEFAKYPEVEIRGVTVGAGLSSDGEDERIRKGSISLKGWKVEGGPLRMEELSVNKKLEIGEEFDLEGFFKFKAVRIRGRFVDDPKSKYHLRGSWTTCETEKKPDPEVAAYQVEVKKPRVVTDEVLGEFKTWDSASTQYSGKAKWNGKEVEVSFDASKPAQVKKALTVLNAVWKEQKKWHEQVMEKVVEDLLELKNEEWLNEGEKELTPAQFKKRLSVVYVSAEPSGKVYFELEDGDVFKGHNIHVNGSLAKGIKDADI